MMVRQQQFCQAKLCGWEADRGPWRCGRCLGLFGTYVGYEMKGKGTSVKFSVFVLIKYVDDKFTASLSSKRHMSIRLSKLTTSLSLRPTLLTTGRRGLEEG